MDIFGEPLLYKPQHSIFLNKLKIPLGVDANNIVSLMQQHTWRLSLTDEDLDGYRKEEENTAVWSFCPGPRAGCRPMKVFLNTELCEAGTLSLCSTEDTETPIS